jgi:hypothetical protein
VDWSGFSGTLVHTHLVHTQLVTTCPHNLSTHNLSTYICAHANPSPSLFSFPHFPSHLYLFFASYWKKLTCGVIRSFNWFLFFAAISTRLGLCFFFKSCLKHSSPSSQTQNRKRFSSEDDMQSSWFPTTLYFTNPWNLCGSASIFLSLRVD